MVALPSLGVSISIEVVLCGGDYPAKLGVSEGLLIGRFVEFLHLTAAGQLTSSNGSNEHLMMHRFQWV
jgi:hypothetical protein